MADKMSIFLKPVIPMLLILFVGIMVGIWIDNYRVTAVRQSISDSEVAWNDARLFNSYLASLGENSCDLALEQNLEYNHRIYERGMEVEKVIKTNVFTPEVEQEWKRYTLLQTQFWLNSIELKEKCNFDYHNVVHLFRLKELSKAEGVDNKIQSTILLNVKEKCGDKIMLIPLSTDLDLISVNSMIEKFNVTHYPAIVIDEKFVLQGVTSEDDLLAFLQC